jgi:hypothetical protein
MCPSPLKPYDCREFSIIIVKSSVRQGQIQGPLLGNVTKLVLPKGRRRRAISIYEVHGGFSVMLEYF